MTGVFRFEGTTPMNARDSFLAIRDYALAVAAVVAIGIVLLPLRALPPAPTVMLLFVPVIVAVSRITDVRVSVVAAVAAFLVLDLLYTPPYYRLSVEPVAAWLALVVFLAVALIIGQQTVRLRQREETAVARQRELELLNRSSFRAASADSPGALASFVVAQATDILGTLRTALYSAEDGGGRLLAEGGTMSRQPDEAEIVSWVLREGKAVGLPADAVPVDQRPVSVPVDAVRPSTTDRGTYLPLQTADGIEGVLLAVPSHPGPLRGPEARLLAALANLSAASLARQRLDEEASHAQALLEADRLKTTLVSSVSHELKTPLAAATARVTALLEPGAADDAAHVREELAAVARDLGRLDSSIGDLLDVSRLESASWEPRVEPFDVREILGTVVSRLAAPSRDRVRFDVADIVPDVLVDGVQLTRAMTNVIENSYGSYE
jgi:two-component system sensor histidine kinase KdpD